MRKNQLAYFIKAKEAKDEIRGFFENRVWL